MSKNAETNADFEPPAEPWPLLATWFAEAAKTEPNDPNAMALATVGADGMPSVRMVLLKSWDKDGFVFFTNRESRKGGQLKQNAKAALCFHWKSQRRQVRVEGATAPVSDAESDAYFASRHRESQIGAWASHQSQKLESREVLVKRAADFKKQYDGMPVPRPPYWGGFRLTPSLIEVWQDGAFRLHDRFVYRRAGDGWDLERQYP